MPSSAASASKVCLLVSPVTIGGITRAGQAVAVDLQSIGDDPVETELGGDAIGKDREPAGDEGSHRTGTAHGRDEALGAGVSRIRRPPRRGHRLGPGQQSDAGSEGGGEIDLTVHRPASDLGDFRAEPEDRSSSSSISFSMIVDFEIGDQQPLAPPGDGLDQNVDRRSADDRADRFATLPVARVEERDRRLLRGQATGAAAIASASPDRGCERGKRGVGAGGDQGDDQAHPCGPTDGTRPPDKRELGRQ